MSIERELLKKVISGDNKGDFFISYDLYKEIETFLEQTEQTEQDPRDFNFYAHMFESGFMRAGREASARFIKEANKRESKDQTEQTQEPDSYTTGVAAKKLFRVLGWTNKGEEK